MTALRVAVIGSGIAGLSAAHRMRDFAHVTLFEADARFGGHTHTVDVTMPVDGVPVTRGVDTGFLVLNQRTYPRLLALLAELDVPLARSDMSFSVQAPGAFGATGLEWSGSSLATVFAQRSNLLRPRFARMLADLLRFNRLATALAVDGSAVALAQPLGEFLQTHRFGREFLDWYFLPMVGCIWSCPTDQMLRFPAATMIRFCHNHGLLQVRDRPQWWTVQGGARQYVRKIVAGLPDARTGAPVRGIARTVGGAIVSSPRGDERFDAAVIATHPDQALALLRDASPQEVDVLGAIRYQPNRAVLHTDVSVLPQRRAAWAAWNYERPAAGSTQGVPAVCLHYLINRLQPLPWTEPVIVSLNPRRAIARNLVMGEFEYAHPVFDAAAIAAQARLAALQGVRSTWFAGAWTGYGFHEDGLKAGEAAADGVRLAATARQPVAGGAPREAIPA